MKDIVDPVLALLRKYTGYQVDQETIPFIIIGLATLPFLPSLYLRIRRWFGDLRAIPDELRVATELISGDISKKLEGSIDRLVQINRGLELRLSERFDALQSSMNLTNIVEALPDDEAIETDKEVAPTAMSPKTRLDWAN